MAAPQTQYRIEAIIRGLENVEALKNSVKRLQNTAAPAAADLDKLKQAATALGSATGRTENDMRTAVAVLKDLRANVAITDVEFKKLTNTINRYERELNQANGTGGKFGKLGQTLGAVAASGVFGGPEGAIGAGIGAFFGPGGALAGGAIGAQVGQIRIAIGETATYASEISKLNIALQSIAGSQSEYTAAQSAINRAVSDFNVPVLEATSGFTRLSASVIGAGGKVSDAERVFRGVSAAVKATGGSAQDVQAALIAMAQVFGKGKVSAEELQGQLGERLPGAVTKFAEATGRTLPQLAKDLEQGTVGLNDLIKFVDALAVEYEGSAKKIADSQDEAGARMKVSLDSLRQALGETFKPIGAELQDSIADLADVAVVELKKTSDGFKALKDLLDSFGPSVEKFLELLNPFVNGMRNLGTVINDLAGSVPGEANIIKSAIQTFINSINPMNGVIGQFIALRDRVVGKKTNAQESGIYGRYGTPESQSPFELPPATKFADPTGNGGGAAKQAADKAAREREQAMRQYERAVESAQKALTDLNREISSTIYETDLLGKTAFETLDLKWRRGAELTKQKLEDLNKTLSESYKERDKAIKAGLGTDEIDIKITKLINAIDAYKQTAADLNDKQFTEAVSDLLGKEVQSVDEAVRAYYELGNAKNYNIEITNGLKDAVSAYIEQIGTLRDAVSDLAQNAFQGLGDAIVELVTTGKTNFRAFVADILKQTARMIIQQLVLLNIMNAIKSAFGGGGSVLGNATSQATAGFSWMTTPMAKGGVFATNGIQPFAQGGIVTQPTLFKFANGGGLQNGLMGEAGPEAIIPLKRGRDGKLGVSGGGGTNVVVNVDAKGTSVQGDNTQGAALGRVISAAVQNELIKQRRPGGLLAA